jgi:YgiT-type zinc finger domain-containing protein
MTQEGYTSIVLEREQTTLVFKQIPAQICDNCGEEYISSTVNKALLHRANEELDRGIMLEMIKFATSIKMSNDTASVGASRTTRHDKPILSNPRAYQALDA